jgi:hypothetical protein
MQSNYQNNNKYFSGKYIYPLSDYEMSLYYKKIKSYSNLKVKYNDTYLLTIDKDDFDYYFPYIT